MKAAFLIASQKKANQFAAEKRRIYRELPKKSFSATRGDFGEARRIKLLTFDGIALGMIKIKLYTHKLQEKKSAQEVI